MILKSPCFPFSVLLPLGMMCLAPFLHGAGGSPANIDFRDSQSASESPWKGTMPAGWVVRSKGENSTFEIEVDPSAGGLPSLKIVSPAQRGNRLETVESPVPEEYLGKPFLLKGSIKTHEVNGRPGFGVRIYGKVGGARALILERRCGYQADDPMPWKIPYTPFDLKMPVPAHAETWVFFVDVGSASIGTTWFRGMELSETTATTAVTNLSLPGSLELRIGQWETLPAVILPSYAEDTRLEWISSDPRVASVDGNGRVTGKGSGTVTVDARSPSGARAACSVTVLAPGIRDFIAEGRLIPGFKSTQTLLAMHVDSAPEIDTSSPPNLTARFDAGAPTHMAIRYKGGRYGSAEVSYTDGGGSNWLYKIHFKKVGAPDGMVSLPLQMVDSSDPALRTSKAFVDGDPLTQANVGENASIDFGLEAETVAGCLGLTFSQGTRGVAWSFELLGSTDGQDWKSLFQGESSGMGGPDQELFDFPRTSVKYIRIKSTLKAAVRMAEVRVYAADPDLASPPKVDGLALAGIEKPILKNQTVEVSLRSPRGPIPAKHFIFKSSNPAVARVDAWGTVTGASQGEAIITARLRTGGVVVEKTVKVADAWFPGRPARPFAWIRDYKGFPRHERVLFRGLTGGLITGLTLHDLKGGTGIELIDCKEVVLHDCEVKNLSTPDWGLHLLATRSWAMENVRVESCRFENIGGDGIKIETSGDQDAGKLLKFSRPMRGIEVVTCRFLNIGTSRQGSPKHGVYAKAEDILLESNIIANVYWGSGLSPRNTARVRFNIISNTTGGCLDFWGQTRMGDSDISVIENNLLVQDPPQGRGPGGGPGDYAGVAGICPAGSLPPPDDLAFITRNWIFRHNTLVGWAQAPPKETLFRIRQVFPHQDIRVIGNLMVDPRSTPNFANTTNVQKWSGNVLATDTGVFMDFAAGDFRPRPNGEAWGSATGGETIPPIDLAGRQRIPGRVDAGAFQGE